MVKQVKADADTGSMHYDMAGNEGDMLSITLIWGLPPPAEISAFWGRDCIYQMRGF